MDHVALAVGENLNLDVPGELDIFFEIDAAVLESFFGLLPCGLEAGLQTNVVAGDAHAPAAASCCRFDQDREPDLMRQV